MGRGTMKYRTCEGCAFREGELCKWFLTPVTAFNEYVKQLQKGSPEMHCGGHKTPAMYRAWVRRYQHRGLVVAS
jgi:hypothetical protein